jgi:type I restriction enzyme S subunit
MVDAYRWPWIKLGELLTFWGSGATPRGGKNSYKTSGIPLVRSMNVHDLHLEGSDLAYIDEYQARELDRVEIVERDVLLNITGASVARCCLAGSSVVGGRVNQHVMILRGDPSVADARWLARALAGPYKRKLLAIAGSGATREALTRSDVEDFIISLPPIGYQQQVSDILDSYERLLENNRRRIEILEEMARLLYREWFVHFRFPGHEDVELVDSDLGPIPKGWKTSRLGDVLELAYGKALRAEDRTGGPVSVYGSGGHVGRHDVALVAGPGIVVGRKGNVGSVYWSDRDFFPIDTTYYVKSDLPLRFLDQLLRTLEFIDSHAAVPGLSREQAYGIVVVEPVGNLVSHYDAVVRSLYDLRRTLSDQTAVLCEARDLLLPRLVSGELDVSELDLDLVTG